ncbi:hypothetical protein JOF56_003713 [Kibdelosporangium banguiense]|uniref:Uncharacterized protein n=1 Tax=Kibdelosporangium banguiense TaxID=1365924 RepID=A0ABS4TFX6_9PSEU|nr:hypothetical protein [Kibdelosporangium banguiense]MBP2323328.1 hypothetical protein [Kibdelosporangium banguiense]
MRADELLILNYSGFSRHVRSLFWNMRDSRSFTELFLRDPAGTISRKVFNGYMPPMPETLNQANRILFSVLSNPGFMEFTRNLQEEMESEARREAANEGIEDFEEGLRLYATRMDRTALYNRVADGLIRNMDRELLFSMAFVDPTTRLMPDPGGGGGGDWCPDIPEPGGKLPDLCPDPKVGPKGPPVGSTLAYHEVAVVTVAVALAFVVVTVIDFTPKPAPVGLTREDIAAVSNLLSDRFERRAMILREQGVLTDPDAIRRGPQL